MKEVNLLVLLLLNLDNITLYSNIRKKIVKQIILYYRAYWPL